MNRYPQVIHPEASLPVISAELVVRLVEKIAKHFRRFGWVAGGLSTFHQPGHDRSLIAAARDGCG